MRLRSLRSESRAERAGTGLHASHDWALPGRPLSTETVHNGALDGCPPTPFMCVADAPNPTLRGQLPPATPHRVFLFWGVVFTLELSRVETEDVSQRDDS